MLGASRLYISLKWQGWFGIIKSVLLTGAVVHVGFDIHPEYSYYLSPYIFPASAAHIFSVYEWIKEPTSQQTHHLGGNST